MDEGKPKKKRKKAAAEGEGGEPKAHKLVISEGPSLRFSVEKIGSAMKVLGFAGYRSHGRRGYRVVRYKIDEIEANRRLLASDAEPENETAGDSGDSSF